MSRGWQAVRRPVAMLVAVLTTLILSACSPLDVLNYLAGCPDTNETTVVTAGDVGHSSNPTIEAYVSWAEGIAADQSHGYSQARRNSQHDYDCSSLDWFAIKHAGFPVGDGWPFTTFNMGPILQSLGFTHFSWSGNMADAAKSLQRGDIVVNPAAHTEIYRGGGSFVGARHAFPSGIEDGRPGDQGSGADEEIGVGPTSPGMTEAYRYTGSMNTTVPAGSTGQGKGGRMMWQCASSSTTPATAVSTDGTHASPEQAKQIARSMLPAKGWGDDQYECLVWVWDHESGWRWNAENPSSGAYGIPQALPADKLAAAGADWHENATTQITWGLGYIQGRYNNPCGAKSFWLSHNWY